MVRASQVQERFEHPHEPGNHFTVRLPTAAEMRESRRLAQDAQLKATAEAKAALGEEMFKLVQEGLEQKRTDAKVQAEMDAAQGKDTEGEKPEFVFVHPTVAVRCLVRLEGPHYADNGAPVDATDEIRDDLDDLSVGVIQERVGRLVARPTGSASASA